MAKKVIISESQLKKIITESIMSSLPWWDVDEKAENFAKIDEWAYGTIDYLYNEGVVDYDDKHICAMAKGEMPINYRELIKAIIYNYGTDCECEAGQMLRNYYNLSKKHGESIPEVEEAIKSAIKRFAEDANCEKFI